MGCQGRPGPLSPNTILFKIITRIKSVFSNYLGHYSYSFRAQQELISVTVTVLCVWREYVFTVTVRYSYMKKWSSEWFSENYSYSYIKKWFSNSKCNDFEKNGTGKAVGEIIWKETTSDLSNLPWESLDIPSIFHSIRPRFRESWSEEQRIIDQKLAFL